MYLGDAFKVCSIRGVTRPLDMFWESEQYKEPGGICSICAAGFAKIEKIEEKNK
jgi:hypothetical protein